MNKSIATQQPVFAASNWDAMRQQAEVLVKSGFLPRDINTPEKAIAVMMTGAELNIPPMQALRQITIIQGKPTVSPELMAALVERDYGSKALIVEESTQERCVVSCFKPGWDKRKLIAFTILDAERAKLTSETWQKYPVAMLRSRAISIACKTYFQASIGGMFTGEELGGIPDELGADVDVVDGEIVIVEQQPRPRENGYAALRDAQDVVDAAEHTEPVRGIVDVLSDELDTEYDADDLPESYFDDDGRLLAPPVTGNPEDDIPTMLDLLDQANNPKRYTQARDYITQIGLHVDPAIAGIMEERDAKLAARRRAAVTA